MKSPINNLILSFSVMTLTLALSTGINSRAADADKNKNANEKSQPAVESEAGGTNKAGEAVEFYKVVTDKSSGEYAVVNFRKDTVIWKDKTGKILSSTNVFQIPEVKRNPKTGGKIHGMTLYRGGLLYVDLGPGRVNAVFDPKTRRFVGIESN